MTTKNTRGKTRDVNDPYSVYVDDVHGWEWRVLKHYQSPEKERENPYARVFCAVKSPMTHGSYDIGDTYLRDIGGRQVYERAGNGVLFQLDGFTPERW